MKISTIKRITITGHNKYGRYALPSYFAAIALYLIMIFANTMGVQSHILAFFPLAAVVFLVAASIYFFSPSIIIDQACDNISFKTSPTKTKWMKLSEIKAVNLENHLLAITKHDQSLYRLDLSYFQNLSLREIAAFISLTTKGPLENDELPAWVSVWKQKGVVSNSQTQDIAALLLCAVVVVTLLLVSFHYLH